MQEIDQLPVQNQALSMAAKTHNDALTSGFIEASLISHALGKEDGRLERHVAPSVHYLH